ncbi:unnamed protein product, partial [Amoebophrya sp. A25]
MHHVAVQNFLEEMFSYLRISVQLLPVPSSSSDPYNNTYRYHRDQPPAPPPAGTSMGSIAGLLGTPYPYGGMGLFSYLGQSSSSSSASFAGGRGMRNYSYSFGFGGPPVTV